MFFITRLTENTNLAVVIPPSEQIFNNAQMNLAIARPRFVNLDVATRAKQSAGQGGGFFESVGRDV